MCGLFHQKQESQLFCDGELRFEAIFIMQPKSLGEKNKLAIKKYKDSFQGIGGKKSDGLLRCYNIVSKEGREYE